MNIRPSLDLYSQLLEIPLLPIHITIGSSRILIKIGAIAFKNSKKRIRFEPLISFLQLRSKKNRQNMLLHGF